MANQTLTTTPSPQPVYIDQNDGALVQQYGSEYRYITREYRALISQAGTAIPSATVLRNTLGGTLVFTRTGAGAYVATLAGAFLAGKVLARVTPGSITANAEYATVRATDNTVTISTAVAGVATDVLLTNAVFTIEVYP